MVPLTPFSPPSGTLPAGSEAFETSARDVAQRLQSALGELVTRGAGRVRKAVELQQRLGIDRNLAWKVFRVISAENLLAEADKVPGWPTMQRLLEAAGDRGVPPEVLERVTEAFEAFQTFVQEHAGDRDSFGAIAAALVPEQSDPFGVAYRKTLFQVQSQLIGRKSETVCRCHFYYGGMDGAEQEECVAIGSFGTRPLRRGITIRIGMQVTPPDHDSSGQKKSRITTPVPVLLREFCRGSLPPAESATAGELGQTSIQLDDLGKNGSVDWAMYARSPSPKSHEFFSKILLSGPCEMLYADILVPAGQSDPSTMASSVYYGMASPEQSVFERPEDLVPIREVMSYRGKIRASEIVPIPEAPRYAEMIRQVARLIGVTDSEFDLYRYRIEYPILYSATLQTVDRAKPPSST